MAIAATMMDYDLYLVWLECMCSTYLILRWCDINLKAPPHAFACLFVCLVAVVDGQDLWWKMLSICCLLPRVDSIPFLSNEQKTRVKQQFFLLYSDSGVMVFRLLNANYVNSEVGPRGERPNQIRTRRCMIHAIPISWWLLEKSLSLESRWCSIFECAIWDSTKEWCQE